jgi:hypothetical protein
MVMKTDLSTPSWIRASACDQAAFVGVKRTIGIRRPVWAG